jgi:hypothetical protein
VGIHGSSFFDRAGEEEGKIRELPRRREFLMKSRRVNFMETFY